MQEPSQEPSQASPPAPSDQPQASKSGGTSGLAVTAFVLSLLFFVPLAPLVGAVLGIVGVIRVRQDQTGRGLAIAAIPVGLVLFLFLQVGMIAAISIPAFIKYTRKAKTVEATEALDKLRLGARAYVQADHYGTSGDLLPKRFPVAETGWVPAQGCCEGPDPKCEVDPASWQQEPWTLLHFGVNEPHYFQYRYRSDGDQLVAEARGDLDCDGTYSSFQLFGAIRNHEAVFQGPRVENEIE
jgi:hypothetical protein